MQQFCYNGNRNNKTQLTNEECQSYECDSLNTYDLNSCCLSEQRDTCIKMTGQNGLDSNNKINDSGYLSWYDNCNKNNTNVNKVIPKESAKNVKCWDKDCNNDINFYQSSDPEYKNDKNTCCSLTGGSRMYDPPTNQSTLCKNQLAKETSTNKIKDKSKDNYYINSDLNNENCFKDALLCKEFNCKQHQKLNDSSKDNKYTPLKMSQDKKDNVIDISKARDECCKYPKCSDSFICNPTINDNGQVYGINGSFDLNSDNAVLQLDQTYFTSDGELNKIKAIKM